jgi:uncharacterized Zn finger protein
MNLQDEQDMRDWSRRETARGGAALVAVVIIMLAAIASSCSSVIERVEEKFTELVNKKFPEVIAQADTNADQKVSAQEWKLWLTQGGGLMFLLALVQRHMKNAKIITGLKDAVASVSNGGPKPAGP